MDCFSLACYLYWAFHCLKQAYDRTDGRMLLRTSLYRTSRVPAVEGNIQHLREVDQCLDLRARPPVQIVYTSTRHGVVYGTFKSRASESIALYSSARTALKCEIRHRSCTLRSYLMDNNATLACANNRTGSTRNRRFHPHALLHTYAPHDIRMSCTKSFCGASETIVR